MNNHENAHIVHELNMLEVWEEARLRAFSALDYIESLGLAKVDRISLTRFPVEVRERCNPLYAVTFNLEWTEVSGTQRLDHIPLLNGGKLEFDPACMEEDSRYGAYTFVPTNVSNPQRLQGFFGQVVSYPTAGFLQFILPLAMVGELWLRIERLVLDEPYEEGVHSYKFCTRSQAWAQKVRRGPDDDHIILERFEPQEYFYQYLQGLEFNPGDHAQLCRLGLNPGGIQALPLSWECTVDSAANYVKADEGLWCLREHARVTCGEYQPLPQEVKDQIDPEIYRRMIPHVAVKLSNAGMIAYTANAAAGVADRQQVMKPGRFIKQYARNQDISDNEVKRLSAMTLAMGQVSYHMTKDRETVSWVYQTGPNSCMAYGPDSSRGNFDNEENLCIDGDFIHPAEVYCHPDNHLMIAYGTIKRPGSDDEVVISRCVVNTQTKTYSTAYGSDQMANAAGRLRSYLEECGYSYAGDCLQGEKLLLLVTDNDAIICPYLDPSNYGVTIDWEKDCLVAGGREGANHATGTLDSHRGRDYDNDWTCACCVDSYSEHTDWNLNEHGERICESCASYSHTYAYVLRLGEHRHVYDEGNYYFFDGSRISGGPGRREDVVAGDEDDLHRYDLVRLSETYYDGSNTAIACLSDTVEDDDGERLMRDEAEDFGLFVDEDGDAHKIDEWAVMIDADGDEILVEREDIDEDEVVLSTMIHQDFPMLPFYVRRQEAADEAPAAVNG